MAEKRMSISLNAVDAKRLETIAAVDDLSQNDVIRKALATQHWLSKQLIQGNQVLVKNRKGEVRFVEFV